MSRSSAYLTLLFVFTLFTGCSGSGGASGGGGSSVYRTTLGSTTGVNVVGITEEALLTRFGYRFLRRVETSEDILFETEWKDLPALEDEAALGFSFARVRITVTARPRSRAAGAVNAFSARFVAETAVRARDRVDWVDAPMTEMREDYVREIADYMKNEILRTR